MKKQQNNITTDKNNLQMLSLRDAEDGSSETVFVRKNADGTIYLHIGYTQLTVRQSDAKAIIKMLQTALKA